MASYRIQKLGLLAYHQISCAKDNTRGLRCLTLHMNEAHVRPLRRLRDGLGVSSTVLLPLHKRLDVIRRYQKHFMPQLSQLPPPIMRGAASLHRYPAVGK